MKLQRFMPCWPDVWNVFLTLKWFVDGVALFVAALVLLLWAPGVKSRGLRISLRIVGGIIGSITIVVVAFGILLDSNDPGPQYRTLRSPDGGHTATLMYDSGFLGRDFSSVKLTRGTCCKHFTVYEYAGPSDITGTTVTWIDSSHLQITYYSDPDRNQHCEARVADVTIICKPLEPPAK
jgi:hypothetical protein